MARKYDLISELYNRTCNTVVRSPESWQSFLHSACNNFRLRFDEQLLIYAQRPDATAVLEIDRWNGQFGRWVNRGARGIAVFEDADRSRQRLLHYFDISDTHASRYSRPVPIWKMKPEYTDDVIASLEGTFGELERKDTLEDAILSAAKNAVEDNLPDYLSDLLASTEDSFLEGLGEDAISALYRECVTNSVAYMLMVRLGIDPREYFEADDFREVTNFTTKNTLNALGFATSDIAEMGLAEISRTITALDRQNRIIADREESGYNIASENKPERSFENGENQLHEAGRLSSPRSDDAGAAGNESWQIRPDEEEVPEGEAQSPVLQSSDELQAERASVGGGAESHRDGEYADAADGEEGRRDREPESGRYDGMGSTDEQYSQSGAGDRDDRSNLRLEWYDREHEDKSLPFFGGDDTIREILATTPHLKASKDEIRAFYEANADEKARTSYIKSIFNNDATELTLSDGRTVGYKTMENVLHLWEGTFENRTKQSYYDWGVIAAHFEAMRLLGELYDTAKPLPSQDGQYSLMLNLAEEKTSAFTFSQEIIDAVLTRGSGVSEGKFRIYEQLQKSLSAKENADFLKDEYGWGGSAPVIIGTGIDEQHDGKGIRISKGIGNDKPHIDLTWTQVEKRIAELIRLDRYLNPKEKELYPEWLSKQEERRREQQERNAVKEVLSIAPPEEKAVPEEAPHYEYHLGDKVYLGADEYEILSFDDERVMLYDTQFPLFQKEETRADFDRKVQENPLNDHLKVLPAEEKTVEYDIGMGYLGNGLTVWNRAVEVNHDYQNIAHISTEGEITYYVDGLPDDVIARIEQAAEQERQKALFAATYQVGDKVYLDGKPFEITRTDEWNVELMDRSQQNPKPRLERKDGFMQLVQQNEGNSRLTTAYDEYNEIKHDNPDSIVLFQVGDFFEMYGEDAQVAAEALELHLTSRSIGGNLRVPMCGIPASRLQPYVDMLRDRGYDVTLAAIEDNQRIIRTLASDRKEEPVESYPVGRIDYLHTDGRVRESIEYTSEYQLVKDIREENSYGVPMTVVFYQDKDGKTISQSFLSELDSPIQGVKVEQFNAPPVNMTQETEEPDDFSDVDPIAVREALAERGIVNGQVVDPEKLNSDPFIRQVMADVGQTNLESEPVKPAWEQKRSRVQTFDLHPDIPMAERHTFDLTSHEVEEVGKKERFRRNMEAIKVLKECEFENRFATPEEQEILSKYVGWGGIPEAFDENNPSWGTEFLELSAALTPEEYASANESALTAFYTPPAVIQGIYKAMEQMGFRDGNILEPACGIGNFIGMLPPSMKEAKMYGVEIDKISAGIAQQLYQRTSIAAQPYEEANVPDSFFDAVVGNVPFGDIRLADKRYDKYHFLIHDYFFAKSLDKLRPGGIMALVTSKGTMDKENPAIRKYIAQRAELLGAIRLPNNTFGGNAGAKGVVSDILILQKRDRIMDIEPEWVHLNTDENGFKMNSYFVDHPEMVLGEWKTVSGRHGNEDTVVPYEGADLAELLEDAISNIHGEITEYEVDEELTEEDDSIPADPNVRNFSYTVVDDQIYYRENSRMTPVEVSATAASRIKGMIQIRDCVRLLLEMQTEDYPDEEIKTGQQLLNNLYDDFTKKYGVINSRANVSAFSQDSSFSLLSALEVLDEEGNLERKADLFTKRTIKPHTPVTSVDTASEALAVSLGEKARIDMEYMCSLSGKSEQEIFADLKGVIFLNPMYGYGNSTEAKYLMADEYLSGNVREKLAWARKSAEVYPEDYKINVEALEKVQPKDLTASEIFVRLGATWVPPEIVEQFMFELLGTPRYCQWNIKVHYSQFTSEWNIEGKSYDRGNVKAYSTYGTARINAYKIIEETLNLKDVRIFDYIEDDEGKKKAVLNAKETAIAQAKQEQIKQAFQDWVWADPDRREKLCKLYNEKFNSIRPREYDGSHITFSGMNPEIELREHQRNAVAHILYGGNTLLAHAVGAGKTFEMVAAAMESKRLGLCNKSLFVVPNHLTEQWAAEFLQLYPAANILVATKKDFETKNRKRFCGRIATGDYDAVIIGHSQFEKIPMSIERQRAILERELNEIVDGIAELKRNRGENFSVKQLQKSKKALETKLKKLNDQSRKDDVVTFEELGVDRLFVDESHYFKNLFLYTKMRNVGGIAQTEAQKSSDLYMKCRYLDELTGGRGTVFATGTPISNSMVVRP